MGKTIINAINKQINLEAYSAYVYLAMAAYVDELSLDGCSSWLNGTSQRRIISYDEIL